jgi:hypothetical protein
LYYRSTGARIREDPALMMLLDTVLSEPMGIIKAVYKIRITIPLISWTGFILKFEENLSFDLGAVAANDQSQIQDLVNQIFNAIG